MLALSYPARATSELSAKDGLIPDSWKNSPNGSLRRYRGFPVRGDGPNAR
jgi:hypothetical protein